MKKRQLYRIWKKFRLVKPYYFLLAAVGFAIIGVIALRANNLHMVQLRDAVYAADKNGGDVENALQNLQMYVTRHMNTELSTGQNAVYPPIQLKYTYDRLVQAAGSSASAANAQIYTDAQAFCERQDSTDFSGRNRVPCIQQYVKDHGVTPPAIPDSLYKFAFVSPVWSPDVAGWSLLLAAVSVLWAAFVWAEGRWLRAASR